jgi:hypothetical protein
MPFASLVHYYFVDLLSGLTMATALLPSKFGHFWQIRISGLILTASFIYEAGL